MEHRESEGRRRMGDKNWDKLTELRAAKRDSKTAKRVIREYRRNCNIFFQMYLWEIISSLFVELPADGRLREFLEAVQSGIGHFQAAAELVLQGKELEVVSITGTPYGLQDKVGLRPKE